jgi:hypothetical protein
MEEHPVRVRLSNHRPLALVASLLSLAIASSAGAAALRVATLGDSTTDEYRGTVGTPFGPKDIPAMNWVEQLAEDRAAYFDFGSLESDPSVRGEPRNDGYSQNWARYGAAAVGPGWSVEPFDSQVAGAAAQITSGDVDLAYIQIGSNDFTVREYAGLTFDPADPGYQAFAQSIFDATFAAVDTLQAAGTTPIALGWFGVATPPQEMFDAAYALNLEIWAEAIHRGVPYFNLVLFRAPGSPALDPTRLNLMFAGELIPLASVADAADLAPPGTPGVGPCSTSGCATEAYAFNYTTHDGLHPGTIVQGFRANEFIKAVNYHFGSSIPLLTEQEILANAIGEPPPCDDGIDNDGDGLIDHPNDPGDHPCSPATTVRTTMATEG